MYVKLIPAWYGQINIAHTKRKNFHAFGGSRVNVGWKWSCIEILLPIKFCWILFSGFRGEVKMSQPIGGRGSHLVFPICPKKHRLGRRHWDLAPCQVLLNSHLRFQRRSRKCLSKSEAGAAISYSDQPEKHKLGRGHWDLASCQVLLNSVQRFQRRSRLFVLLTFHICLRLRWTKNSKLYYIRFHCTAHIKVIIEFYVSNYLSSHIQGFYKELLILFQCIVSHWVTV